MTEQLNKNNNRDQNDGGRGIGAEAGDNFWFFYTNEDERE